MIDPTTAWTIIICGVLFCLLVFLFQCSYGLGLSYILVCFIVMVSLIFSFADYSKQKTGSYITITCSQKCVSKILSNLEKSHEN
jgi:glucan phosphoethanolaminetransferase (alkaline phosphatase superfamily)